MKKKKVLVTGLFTQAGMFAVRRFAQMGMSVTAADNHTLAFGMHSRYVSKKLLLPSLKNEPEAYAEAIIDELKKGNYDYYFPSFEESYLMSHYKNSVKKYSSTILSNPKKLLQLHDKKLLRNVVKKAGCNYPETYAPRNIQEARSIASGINFPVYIKMRQSCNSTGLRFVKNPENIMDAYNDVIERNSVPKKQLPLIQQLIQGREIVVNELAQNGRVIGDTLYKGIRCIPRSGGTTTCRESLHHDSCVKEADRFIKHISWTGFISMDFLIDENDGKIYIIDCNPRPSVSINMGFYGGVDMIPQWCVIADGEPAKKLPSIKPGIKSATGFADFLWYLQTFVKGPESWSERKKMRKKWWEERKSIIDDMYAPDDKKPSLVLLVFLVFQALKMLFTKLEASSLYLYYNSFDMCCLYPERNRSEKIQSEKTGLQESGVSE